MAPGTAPTLNVRPPVVFTDIPLSLPTTFVRVVRAPPQAQATAEASRNGGINKEIKIALLYAGAVVLAVIITLLSWLFLRRYHWRRNIKFKRQNALEDPKLWIAFAHQSSSSNSLLPDPNPYKPQSHLDEDLGKSLRSIRPTSRPPSDLPLRNTPTPPSPSPTISKSVKIPADLNSARIPVKPLLFRGVPIQRFRTRKTSHTTDAQRVRAMGEYQNIDGVFVKVEDADEKAEEQARPSSEHTPKTRRVLAQFGERGRGDRGSTATEITHITTGASVVQAVEVGIRSVSPDVVEVGPVKGDAGDGVERERFVVGDREAEGGGGGSEGDVESAGVGRG
ncbi:hypothetical protein K458DRAFT_394640 [Lentithecium fluviatile CBS 122367]|uniref:Uncharacterized protein n=1 Tax=Lentithecium fluviatile CBS 122367 TaxID=1168545 RepID=A0A6G1IKM4_9PLEO|nr:hypothetical protein K458DRAFT_394640 [Lentithecium fluviatile CBS 122367]